MYVDELNPWWYTGRVPKNLQKEYRRKQYAQARDVLESREIIIITGMRRVGKTTILYQLIDHLLEKGVEPKNVLYYSFDTGDERPTEIIREFLSVVAVDGRKYVFLDEIQWAENWAGELKRIYDTMPDIKIVVSGSASVLVESDALKYLAGRFYPLEVPTLHFKEFCEMKGIRPEPWMESKLSALFKEFLAKGGFPGWVDEDPQYIRKILQELVLERVIFRDIPCLRRFRNVNALRQLAEYVCENSGFLAVMDDLARVTGVSKPTLSEMLQYLKKTYLVRVLRNYGSPETAARTHKKLYVADHGLYFGRDVGKRFETLMVNQMGARTFFRRGRREVDIVTDSMAVEVKKSAPSPREVRSLKWFAEKYRKQPLVVTVSDEGEVAGVPVIPAWKFLIGASLQGSSSRP